MGAGPRVEAIEAGGVDAAGADASHLFGFHQSTFSEDLEMLADGGEGDAEGVRQTRDRGGRATEHVQDGAAGGVAERVKKAVDLRIVIGQGVRSLPADRGATVNRLGLGMVDYF